jgi:hypothetical protein
MQLPFIKDKEPEAFPGSFFPAESMRLLYRKLQLSHLSSLRAFGAATLDEADPIAFAQGLETASLDSGEVHEQITSAVSFNKAKTFAVVEPLDSTFRHSCTPR